MTVDASLDVDKAFTLQGLREARKKRVGLFGGVKMTQSRYGSAQFSEIGALSVAVAFQHRGVSGNLKRTIFI
jgi:hypothetical protein